MRIFKNIRFTKFANKSGITDKSLCKAVMNAEQGLIDADLGGGVIKQRVARYGEGKSGGFRTIVIFKQGDTAFFVYGFAKNERDNISKEELTEFRRLATVLFGYGDQDLASAVKDKILSEVICEEAIS